MRCDQVRELAPLRLLDLLDEQEAAELRAHLEAGCPGCAAELAAARETLDLLPYALPEAEPSPMAKARLMAAVGREAAARDLPASARAGAPTWARTAAASLVAALVTGALTGALVLRRQEAMRAEIERQGEELAHLRLELSRARESIQLASTPFVTVVDLQGQGPQAGAAARVFWDRGRSAWQLFAANLPSPERGKSYQLWLITAEQKISAGTFSRPEAGPAAGTVVLPAGSGPVLAAAVTDEPEGGSPQPTGSILLLGKI